MDEVAQVLSTNGVSSTSSTGTYQTVFRGFTPSTSNIKQIAVRGQGSLGQEVDGNDRGIWRTRGQLLIRGQRNASTDLEATAESARDALNLAAGTYANIRWVDSFSEEPLFTGYDDDENPIYSVNFTVLRAQST